MEIKKINGVPDFASIINLINTEWPPEFGEKTDNEKISEMIKNFNSDTDTVKYLYKQNMVIGFYRFSSWPRDSEQTNTAHIMDIAILPSYQKKGLGTLLMNDLISECRKSGFNTILSRTFRHNRESIKLHQSCGCSIRLETEDSIVWELNINEE